MSTALQPATPPADAKLSEWVQREDVHGAIRAAVGTQMDCDQFMSHALVSLQDPKLAHCTPASKLKAMYEMAALGLLATSKQCALIVRDTKVTDPKGRTWKEPQVTVMPQWQGYKAVMERHPAVLEVQAYLVHVTDQLQVDGGEVEHAYDPLDPKRIFASSVDLRGGYAKVLYADGRKPRFHFVPVAHIEKCRKCAQTQNVWSNWYEQMALKTIYRDAYARQVVPVDPLVSERVERLTRADDAILGNSPYRVAASLPSGNERLRERLTPQAEGEPEPAEPAEPDPADESQASDLDLDQIVAELTDASGIQMVRAIVKRVLDSDAPVRLKTEVEALGLAREEQIRAGRGQRKEAEQEPAGAEK